MGTEEGLGSSLESSFLLQGDAGDSLGWNLREFCGNAGLGCSGVVLGLIWVLVWQEEMVRSWQSHVSGDNRRRFRIPVLSWINSSALFLKFL